MQAIVATVEALLAATVEAQGVELYDLEFITEYGRKVLRLYIDKEGGVDLNDCERVSRAVEPALDAHDPIPHAYVLEVSSPGIERKLVKASHYLRHIGEVVEVKLHKPLAETKRRNFTGVLIGFNENEVQITTDDGNDLQFSRDAIARCRLIVDSSILGIVNK